MDLASSEESEAVAGTERGQRTRLVKYHQDEAGQWQAWNRAWLDDRRRAQAAVEGHWKGSIGVYDWLERKARHDGHPLSLFLPSKAPWMPVRSCKMIGSASGWVRWWALSSTEMRGVGSHRIRPEKSLEMSNSPSFNNAAPPLAFPLSPAPPRPDLGDGRCAQPRGRAVSRMSRRTLCSPSLHRPSQSHAMLSKTPVEPCASP